MPSFFSPSRLPLPSLPVAPPPDAAAHWHDSAAADYQMARCFADRFEARLVRKDHSYRVGWERDGRRVYGILLPDPLPAASLTDHDWYIYYVWGETLFRRTAKEREKLRMLILPDGVEDWASLLRQAVRGDVFDVRWEMTPHYVNPLGEIETAPSGFEFTLSACAPPGAAPGSFQVAGMGETPEAAARDACRRWLKENLPDVSRI